MGNCKPTETRACNTQSTHTEKQFSHPKIAKLQKGTFAKWFVDKKKHYNEAHHTITKILQNRKKLTDEMNLRFRTTKTLGKKNVCIINKPTKS